MANILENAKRELDLIGMTDDGDYNGMMRKHLLHMIEEFEKEGHSGFSANYAANMLNKLFRIEPLSPLTGEDDEWADVSESMGKPYWQNKRYTAVFKDADGKAHHTGGLIFWEWVTRPLEEDEPGYPGVSRYKSYYTSKGSSVEIEFPYTPKVEYKEQVSDAV